MILYTPSPSYLFIYANNTVICTGDTVNIYSILLRTDINNAKYQWYKITSEDPPIVLIPNATGSTYSTNLISNGQKYYLEVTGYTSQNLKSNELEFTVYNKNTPTIIIAREGEYSLPYICKGTEVQLLVSGTTYGGARPRFQWQSSSNGVGWSDIEGVTGATFSFISNNDIYFRCVMTSSDSCLITDTADSNSIHIVVTTIPTITVDIQPEVGVCSGTSITYYADSVNAGTNPLYTWYVNNIYKTSGYSNAYSSYTYTPNDGDIIGVSLYSSANCANYGVYDSTMAVVQPLANLTIDIESSYLSYYYEP